MGKPGQTSFRRILLARILLLSVPVLLLGEAVTYKKVRSILLETARANLSTSAYRKGESIASAIAALKANLFVASQTTVLKAGQAQAAQNFLMQLAPQLPTSIQCLQLENPQTDAIIASTCSNNQVGQRLSPNLQQFAPQQPLNFRPQFDAAVLSLSSRPSDKLYILLSTPVYSDTGKLRYVLTLKSNLEFKATNQSSNSADYTVVLAQNGEVLANPLAKQKDAKSQLETTDILKFIVNNALAQPWQNSDLFYFDNNSVELIAAYSTIPSPLPTQTGQKWIILAVMPTDKALYHLQEIKIILVVLTICLLGASLLATLYLARDLARPLEKLRDYALNVQSHQRELLRVPQLPQRFTIREMSQLAEAIDHMVERLQAWALEIETAWEEAQTANKLKSEFLATTSHELRTPLNGIIGCVRLVLDGCCDDREEEIQFLQQADEAAIHLLGIINDLLDISKIEAGKLPVVMTVVDLRQVLKEVINLQTVHIQQKGLQLLVPDWKEPIMVYADPAKLKQVLLNVIGNAVKFTDRGGITIFTRLELATTDGDAVNNQQVVITIQDTGVGIDPAQQQKLFRPFVMVDGTTTRKFGGTGLGLAISRSLVELMEGSIKLYSPGLNQGTTVAISLRTQAAKLPDCIPSLSAAQSAEN